MKTIWFHMQGYRDLPDDFRDRYESIWVTPPNDELCHSAEVAKYLHWNLDGLSICRLGIRVFQTNDDQRKYERKLGNGVHREVRTVYIQTSPTNDFV